MLKCIECGFTHHIPSDHAAGPVRFFVDPAKVMFACVYGTFTVSLAVKEFFTIEAVPASGLVLEASIAPNMNTLHAHMLSHCDPLFLIILQSPSQTRHEYQKHPEGATFVRFTKSKGIDIVGNINVAKAEIPGVS
jgi:hypothetical protein